MDKFTRNPPALAVGRFKQIVSIVKAIESKPVKRVADTGRIILKWLMKEAVNGMKPILSIDEPHAASVNMESWMAANNS